MSPSNYNKATLPSLTYTETEVKNLITNYKSIYLHCSTLHKLLVCMSQSGNKMTLNQYYYILRHCFCTSLPYNTINQIKKPQYNGHFPI